MTKNDGSEQNYEIRIPPLEYFSLERAAKLLDCEIGDLLHWGKIGAIDLCVLLEMHPSVLMLSPVSGTIDNHDFYNSHNSGFGVLPFHEDTREPFFMCNSTSARSYLAGNTAYYEGVAEGLWALKGEEIRNLINKGSALFPEFIQPTGHKMFADKHDFTAHLISRQHFESGMLWSLDPKKAERQQSNPLRKEYVNPTIYPQDLFISRKHVLLLKKSIEESASIPNYINGGVTRLELESKPHGNVEASAAKREAVYKAAIYWLLNEPASCNGKRGKLTVSAWADKIIAERNNPKTSVELGKETIEQCLSSAMNGRL